MKSIIEGRFAGCAAVQRRGHNHNAVEQIVEPERREQFRIIIWSGEAAR